MTTPRMSAAAIQAEVSRLVHQIKAVKDDQQSIAIPLPAPLAVLDAGGCNWYMAYGGIVGIYGHAVRDVVQQVKDKWNLEN